MCQPLRFEDKKHQEYGWKTIKWLACMCNGYEYVRMSMSMNTCTFVCMCTKVREWVSNVTPYLPHSFVTVFL